jgi:type II secretory pathway component PulC
MAKPTPEEKLFAVIQGAKMPPIRGKRSGWSLATAGAQVGAFVRTWDLVRTNQLLTRLVVLLAAWAIVNPILMAPRIERLVMQARRQAVAFRMPRPFEGLHSAQDDIEVLHRSDPFRVEPQLAELSTSPPAVVEPPEPVVPDLQSVVADFKLVGISMDPEPVAMIEQVSTKQTHFLRAGDVVGSATVKRIEPTRVILQVGDLETELF